MGETITAVIIAALAAGYIITDDRDTRTALFGAAVGLLITFLLKL